jgi:predicted nuclease of predicted toxin-antitoxin system
VRFLIDAQLPRRLAVQLSALGHDAIHTLDLPEGNRTSDQLICARADATDAAVVTKDADFVINRTLHGSPQRLLVIATGNIANPDLIHLIETNLDLIESALKTPAHVELGRESLVIHRDETA